MTAPTDTRTPLPDAWEARRAKGRPYIPTAEEGRAWAWGNGWPAEPKPSIVETLASLPQISSRRVADEIVRELAGRGFEIVAHRR